MAGVRKALIVATDVYGDPKLTRLDAPAEDARALAEVLRDPEVGVYEVETVLNKTCQEVEVAIATFFQAGARGDTLLLHFSCHGVKDLSGELYFATTDTRLPLLKVTAVSSSMVKTAMEESRASLILCLVDCCYSGAFTKSTKAAATVDLTERLGGRGRAVITASTSLQLALDGKEEPSLFTHAVVEGLRSGEADRDMDGLVTLDEFYSYVHEKVTEKNPDQTPLKSFDVQGEVYVAAPRRADQHPRAAAQGAVGHPRGRRGLAADGRGVEADRPAELRSPRPGARRPAGAGAGPGQRRQHEGTPGRGRRPRRRRRHRADSADPGVRRATAVGPPAGAPARARGGCRCALGRAGGGGARPGRGDAVDRGPGSRQAD